MPKADGHGTRRHYQGGCRCRPCKAANAAYQRRLYEVRAKGKAPMGALVDAVTARKIVRGMLVEGFTFAEIARRLGLKCGRFRLHTDRVTRRRFLKLRRLYRQIVLDAPDTGTDAKETHA